MGTFLANVNQKDLDIIIGLIENGKIKPVIDRTYPLGAAAEAFRYLATGHVQGKIVIIVENVS